MAETGTVKWFSPRKGYGFIIRDGMTENDENYEIFCHYSSITMEGFKTLLPGLRVSFDVESGRKEGSVEAKSVKIIPKEFEEKKE
jgi:cold shock protein